MRLHRFYTTEQINPQSEIVIYSAELVNQIRKVFRLKTGNSVVLFDGLGSDYECVIDRFGEGSKIKSDNTIFLHVATTKRSAFLPTREIILCAGIVKRDTFEWIVEKATELGVTKIIPIIAERSEKKALNGVRLKKIAIEASEQSGRGNVPEIHPIISLKEAVEWVSAKKINAVVFHTEGDLLSRSTLEGRPRQQLEVFIGPEGGWSPDELNLFHKNKIPVVCLGNQVLRAETAAVSALSVLMFGN
ncbi:MAG: RsmE family RNA methyltransferase [Patescibacteria group bacterium]